MKTGSRGCVVLLALLLLVAGCSGPEDGNEIPAATVASADSPIAAATTDAPALEPTAPVVLTATAVPPVPTPAPTVIQDVPVCDTGVVLLDATDELDKAVFEGQEVGGLSALGWSGDSDGYVALSDRGGRVYSLDLPRSGAPSVTATFRLRDATGAPDDTIDGEGLAVLPGGELLVSSEAGPSIRQYAPDGEYLGELLVPERFLVQPDGRAVGNATFESLALAPSGQHLFTAVEQPLDGDGVTEHGQGRVRLLRYDLVDGAFQPAAEYLYLAEPDQGVAEIVAVSETEILVLERGLSLLTGFSARVFRVSLGDAADVSAIDRLEESDARPATKELLVDIADCPSGNAASGGINPLLDNFESMALGPSRPDGSQTLILGSDDNFQSFQVTRYLIFAIDPDRL